MTVSDLIAELQGTVCRCGQRKKTMQTFCARCYFRLTKAERSRLYDEIGYGYEEAYAAACRRLDASDQRPAGNWMRSD